VVGGHSRSVGKTSVVAELIAALREYNWTALKITQFGHGICSADGKPCDCDTGDDHFRAISDERDTSGESDTSRFLVAGAKRSIWVRTRQGRLGEAMDDIRRKIAGAGNVIMESNSVLEYLKPDLYLSVLNPEKADFKESACKFLERADAVVLHKSNGARWTTVSLDEIKGKPAFMITPPPYVTGEMVSFVRESVDKEKSGDRAIANNAKIAKD
jgi:hypothetical protein